MRLTVVAISVLSRAKQVFHTHVNAFDGIPDEVHRQILKSVKRIICLED
jgi:hypothetical protein